MIFLDHFHLSILILTSYLLKALQSRLLYIIACRKMRNFHWYLSLRASGLIADGFDTIKGFFGNILISGELRQPERVGKSHYVTSRNEDIWVQL